MELITFIQPINNGDDLEYKLNYQPTIYRLTNVSKHLGGIHQFRQPATGAANDRFLIEYSANRETIIDDLNSQVAQYVLLKEKEQSRYLIDVEIFNVLFN